MKHFLNQIFVTLGVIFLLLIIAGVYFFITDPYNIKPLIFGITPMTVEQNSVSNEVTSENSAVEDISSESSLVKDEETNRGDVANPATLGFELSIEQRQALTGLGIDPATIPTSVSPEQEACFVSTLGEARVTEIKAGAVPGGIEFLKAKSCI